MTIFVKSENEVLSHVFYCCIGTFLMADKLFRVLLDLTELHIECLKYVWMSVSPEELKTIADFKGSVLRKINLDKLDIKLFVRNGLLLDDETVMVLREDDIVKVHHVNDQSGCFHTENHLKESKKSSRKRNHIENLWDSSTKAKRCKSSRNLTEEKEAFQFVETGSKKKSHKHLPIENLYNLSNTNEVKNCNKNFHNSNEKGATSKKQKDFNSLKNCELFLSFDDQDSIEERNSIKLKNNEVDPDSYLKLNSSNNSSLINVSPKPENDLKKSFDINTETIKSSDGPNNNCPKKKRKRRKKRKQGLECVVDVPDNTEMNKEFTSFTTDSEKSIQKHVVYSSGQIQKKDIQIGFGSKTRDIEELRKDTFVFEVSNDNVKPNNYPKVSTPAQSDFCKDPKWSSSLMQETNLNFYQNETNGFKKGKYRNCSHSKNTDKQSLSFDKSENEKSSELSYANLPPLNSRPDIGAHIAYKILELDEHYSPVISGYREGIVRSINLDTEEMEIELLKHEIKPGRTGKFENLKPDEVPLPEIKMRDFVRWSTLVEPKSIAC